MSRTFSLAHLTLLHCPPPQLIEIAARAGYDFVSLRMTAVTTTEQIYPLIHDRRLMRETKERLADTGLEVLDVELVRLDPATEPESFLPFLEAGAELGARAVIVQLPDPERNRAVERYARICDLARPYNLHPVLEFVSWTETPDLRSAVDIIRKADRENGGLLVDMLHFDRSGSNSADLENLPRNWFHFVHLCDAPRQIPVVAEGFTRAARTARLFPGEGDLDIGTVLRRIPEVPCSLEIPNAGLLQQLGEEEFARRALAAARAWFAARPGRAQYGAEQTGKEHGGVHRGAAGPGFSVELSDAGKAGRLTLPSAAAGCVF